GGAVRIGIGRRVRLRFEWQLALCQPFPSRFGLIDVGIGVDNSHDPVLLEASLDLSRPRRTPSAGTTSGLYNAVPAGSTGGNQWQTACAVLRPSWASVSSNPSAPGRVETE